MRYRTGFASLDGLIGGLDSKECTVLAGPESAGKSSFALSLCANLARQDVAVGYLSRHLDVNAMVRRLTKIESGLDDEALSMSGLGDDEAKRLGKALDFLDEAPVYLFDRGIGTFDELEMTVEHLTVQKGIRALVVDSLSDWRDGIELGRLVNAMKELADLHDLAVFATVSVDGSLLEGAGDGTAVFERTGRWLSSVADVADRLLCLYRYSLVKPSVHPILEPCTLACLADRNGCVGECRLVFRTPFSRFEDVKVEK